MTVNSNPKKLLRTLRPLMFLSQIMGLTFPSHVQRKHLRLIIIYRVIILSLLTLALIREIPTVIFWSRNLKGIHGMLAFIETRLRWFAVLVNFILTTLSNTSINNSLIKLINSPLILKQKEYNCILKYELGILIITTFLVVSYMCLGHDVLWLNPYYSWYTSSIYIITEFYIGFANLQFVIFLIVVRKYFQALNENLAKCDFKPESSGEGESFLFLITKGYKQDNVTEIVKFRHIHMNLTTICWKMNQCFSLQILLFLVVCLMEITYSLRAVTVFSIKANHKDTSRWSTEPVLEALLICVWGGYYMWSILQVVCSCDATAVEANKTAGVVHELLNKIEDKSIKEQVTIIEHVIPFTQVNHNVHTCQHVLLTLCNTQLQIFSLQIMNHRVCFSAGKFVTLNYPLLNSIIGTITTYLVIIMTFSD